MHHRAEDMINLRPCRDSVTGVDLKRHYAHFIGDLPVIALDREGKKRSLIIRGVRLIPEFTDTLISVDQLWDKDGVDARFANKRYFDTVLIPKLVD